MDMHTLFIQITSLCSMHIFLFLWFVYLLVHHQHLLASTEQCFYPSSTFDFIVWFLWWDISIFGSFLFNISFGGWTTELAQIHHSVVLRWFHPFSSWSTPWHKLSIPSNYQHWVPHPWQIMDSSSRTGDGTNFVFWKEKMKAAIVMKGLRST